MKIYVKETVFYINTYSILNYTAPITFMQYNFINDNMTYIEMAPNRPFLLYKLTTQY